VLLDATITEVWGEHNTLSFDFRPADWDYVKIAAYTSSSDFFAYIEGSELLFS